MPTFTVTKSHITGSKTDGDDQKTPNLNPQSKKFTIQIGSDASDYRFEDGKLANGHVKALTFANDSTWDYVDVSRTSGSTLVVKLRDDAPQNEITDRHFTLYFVDRSNNNYKYDPVIPDIKNIV